MAVCDEGLFLLVVLVRLVGVGGHEFFEGSFELLGDAVHVVAHDLHGTFAHLLDADGLETADFLELLVGEFVLVDFLDELLVLLACLLPVFLGVVGGFFLQLL